VSRLGAATGAGLASLLAPALARAAPPTGGIGLPVDASADGWRIDRLLEITNYLAGALAVVALAWMLYAVLVHGRRRQAAYTHGTRRREIAVPLAIAAVVFLVVDGNLFVTSTRDLSSTFGAARAAATEPGAVRVEVNARQWAWEVRYAGLDGVFATDDDVVLMNELWAPVGKPVVVELAATDVIHSFNLPSFRVKTDAVPGRVNTTWFRPRVLGDYEIACAQFCGAGHYKMRGLVHVVPDKAFRALVADRSRDAARMHAEAARARAEAPPRDAAWPAWRHRRPPGSGGWPWGAGG
jgi:cytochrome c oxidase subunit 2